MIHIELASSSTSSHLFRELLQKWSEIWLNVWRWVSRDLFRNINWPNKLLLNMRQTHRLYKELLAICPCMYTQASNDAKGVFLMCYFIRRIQPGSILFVKYTHRDLLIRFTRPDRYCTTSLFDDFNRHLSSTMTYIRVYSSDVCQDILIFEQSSPNFMSKFSRCRRHKKDIVLHVQKQTYKDTYTVMT